MQSDFRSPSRADSVPPTLVAPAAALRWGAVHDLGTQAGDMPAHIARVVSRDAGNVEIATIHNTPHVITTRRVALVLLPCNIVHCQRTAQHGALHKQIEEVRKMSVIMNASEAISNGVVLGHVHDWYRADAKSCKQSEPKQMFSRRRDPFT